MHGNIRVGVEGGVVLTRRGGDVRCAAPMLYHGGGGGGSGGVEGEPLVLQTQCKVKIWEIHMIIIIIIGERTTPHSFK